MDKYIFCAKKTFPSFVLQSLLAILTINHKHYLNTVVSNVTENSTTVEVNLSDNVALSLTLNAIPVTRYKLVLI